MIASFSDSGAKFNDYFIHTLTKLRIECCCQIVEFISVLNISSDSKERKSVVQQNKEG